MSASRTLLNLLLGENFQSTTPLHHSIAKHCCMCCATCTAVQIMRVLMQTGLVTVRLAGFTCHIFCLHAEHPETQANSALSHIVTEALTPMGSLWQTWLKDTAAQQVEAGQHDRPVDDAKQAASTSCTAPGIMVDTKEVTSRLAIRVLIMHLAQRGFVGIHSCLEVLHQ